jgi:uncharacterized protein YjbI with pentapeptide repeats
VKFEIKHRWSGELLFAIETDSWKLAVEAAVKSGANLSWADLSKADLSWANLSEANLSWANLSWANLSDADLSWANLSWADLSKADLSWADLSKADLSKADLSWANLSEADLSWANLSEADLRYIKHDIWGILLHAIPEVPALRAAIAEGRINGSVYEGECACLCGTIANARKCEVEDLEGITPDNSSMAERFFMGIKEDDTPATNAVSKIALEWVDEFIALIKAAPTTSSPS